MVSLKFLFPVPKLFLTVSNSMMSDLSSFLAWKEDTDAVCTLTLSRYTL